MSPPVPDHEAIMDLLGVYALGAVENRERREIEAHLHSCSSCQDELARHATAVAGLVRVSVELGPDRAAHLMDVEGAASNGGGEPRSPQRRTSPLRPRAAARIGVTTVVLLLVSVLTAAVLTRQRLDEVEGRLARAEQIEQLVARATGRDTRAAHLSSALESVSLDVVVLSDGNAMVWKNRLPALSPGRSYYLWAVVSGQRLPIGRLDPSGRPQVVQVPSGASGMVVTEERSSGPPEGTRLVVAGGVGVGA